MTTHLHDWQVYRDGLVYRLSEIMRRFVRTEDAPLSDYDFVRAVYGRFILSREDYILDPNE